ncbi:MULTISPECIES: DNA-directed RNA polymerase subunit delta [unclassified Virgibacillus]|uniref:DNA-directed RNA polymerase subunit delta n=1 Tax=unclassified Virgibacillus TaxID=2620237 RepID=UPI0024DED136|nr:DNA-directed RNA polymerase subunit delta [Virgibacillus sp. LDC-1]
MSLKNYSREELKQMSMIELADLILLDEKKAIHFKDIFDKIADLKELTNKEKDDYIAQFYTDLNVDGRFMMIGSNMWGLKRWYPVEQIDEVIMVPKKKKAKKKKAAIVEDDLDFEEEDEAIEVDDIDEDDFDDEFEDYDDEDLDDEDLEDEEDDLEDDLDFEEDESEEEEK